MDILNKVILRVRLWILQLLNMEHFETAACLCTYVVVILEISVMSGFFMVMSIGNSRIWSFIEEFQKLASESGEFTKAVETAAGLEEQKKAHRKAVSKKCWPWTLWL